MGKVAGIVKEYGVAMVWMFFIIVAPFLYAHEGGDGFHTHFGVVLLSCLSVAVVFFKGCCRFPQWTWTDVFLLLLALFQFGQILAAHSDAETVAGGLCWFLVYVMVRILCLQAAHAGRLMLAAIILSALIQSLVAGLQLGGLLTSNHPLFSITGSFMNPAPLGGCLAVGIVLGICGSIRKPLSRKKGLIGASLLLGMSAMCLLSDSRSAWLAFAAGGAAAAFCFSAAKWIRISLPLLWGIGVFGLYFYRPASADGRMLIWRICARMIDSAPWFGHGVGTFRSEYMNWQGEYFAQGAGTVEEILLAADNVHPYDELLRVLCEQGVVGGLLVFGAVVGCMGLYKKMGAVNRMALCGVVTWVAFSCFSYPCDVFPLQITLPLLLAVAVPAKVRRVRHPLPLKVVTVSLCLFGSLYTVIDWSYLASVRRMLSEHYISDDVELEEVLNREFCRFADNRTCVALYARNLFEKGLYEEAVPIMRRSIVLQPSGRKYLALGDACQYAGDTLLAEHCYLVASRMLPGHVLPVYNRFCLARERGDSVQADTLAHRLLQMPVKVENTVVQEARHESEAYLNLRKQGLPIHSQYHK